jgi:hypothetical protein
MILHGAGPFAPVRAPFRMQRGPAMIENEIEQFDVRAVTRQELQRQVSYTQNMLLASAAASFAIVGASAFFLSFWI